MKSIVTSSKQKASLYQLLNLINQNKFLTLDERKLLKTFIKNAKKEGYDDESKFGVFKQIETITISKQKEFLVNESSLLEFWRPVIEYEEKKGKSKPKIFLNSFLGVFDGTILSEEDKNTATIYGFYSNSLPPRNIIKEAERVSIKRIFSPLATLYLGREIIMKNLVEKTLGTVIFFDTGNTSNNFLSFLSIHRHGAIRDRLEINFKMFQLGDKKNLTHRVIF